MRVSPSHSHPHGAFSLEGVLTSVMVTLDELTFLGKPTVIKKSVTLTGR